MSSLGRFTAAAVAATQETTLTLANLNFDFSLCKFEAPAEYRALGECLSRRRRDAAENGNEHIFARKLGALFSSVIPSTPNLIKTYGKRASEIIQEASADGGPTAAKSGIFSEWTGPDATSIWAAATSGPGGHRASEAEAIWDEIIQVRKRELLDVDPSDPLRPAAHFAAQIEITRRHISSWDSSARAWLEIADRSKLRQQKQLCLLIEDVSGPVSQTSDTYRSVLETWTTALTTMEEIVSGMPQTIQDGSALLALTSWHLYPDMFVLGAGPATVAQHDPLLPSSAVITLGQSTRSPDADSKLCWSLPLAYLKYYGDPVVSTRALGETTTRLTVSDFTHVLFGSLLAGWEHYGENIEQAAELIVVLNDFLARHRVHAVGASRSWIQLLADSAEEYLTTPESDRQYIRSLIFRGRRRYKNFLFEPSEAYPLLFGLTNVNTLLKLMTNMETKVTALRLIAESLVNARPDSLLIRYPAQTRAATEKSHFSEAFSSGRNLFDSRPPWEYATALRQEHNPKKRKLEPDADDLSEHVRWRFGSSDSTVAETAPAKPERVVNINFDMSYDMLVSLDYFRWPAHLTASLWPTASDYSHQTHHLYQCILGDPGDAAIFKKSEAAISGSEEIDINIIITALRSDWVDKRPLVDLLECSGKFQVQRPPRYLYCLRALAAAVDAYRLMPGATITTGVFSEPLTDALWMPAGLKSVPDLSGPVGPVPTTGMTQRSLIYGTGLDPRLLSRSPLEPSRTDDDRPNQHNGAAAPLRLTTFSLRRPNVFACIAMFENRNINLDPRALEKVMAISTGNSIYVAMPLICDPFEQPNDNEVKRITGNISKPGLSLMIPPLEPKIRKVDETQWTMINHAVFDGLLDDAFEHTSLHLSFTRYQLPVAFDHGFQSIEANYVETLVSVYDREEWVGDLDILRALEALSLQRVDADMMSCRHKRPRKTPRFPLTSIDSWNEFIDLPLNPCIFRAFGNWLGRLSAAALGAQQGHRVILFQNKAKISIMTGRVMVVNSLWTLRRGIALT
ncbi:hypothetical protein N0V88_006263 [Collariella sp. IMI 366227]|nr:hypothetical protein N0V88_006263 [Collariella sp. IMI 366227]